MDKIYIEIDEDKLKKYNISLCNAKEYLDKLFAKMKMERDMEGWFMKNAHAYEFSERF